jgi:hypothetical protein
VFLRKWLIGAKYFDEVHYIKEVWMKFTIVFPSHESRDLSIGCVFAPCLVWTMGSRKIDIPHPRIPNYIAGYFQSLASRSEIRNQIESHSNNVVVVVQPTGHGSHEDLQLLLADIRKSDLEPVLVHMATARESL